MRWSDGNPITVQSTTQTPRHDGLCTQRIVRAKESANIRLRISGRLTSRTTAETKDQTGPRRLVTAVQDRLGTPSLLSCRLLVGLFQRRSNDDEATRERFRSERTLTQKKRRKSRCLSACLSIVRVFVASGVAHRLVGCVVCQLLTIRWQMTVWQFGRTLPKDNSDNIWVLRRVRNYAFWRGELTYLMAWFV